MTAARRANDTRVEARRARELLEQLAARAAAGQAIEEREINHALQLVRITEYHAARTVLAFEQAAGCTTTETEAAPCL